MLTQTQSQILNFIKSFQEKNGYAPSLEEIRQQFKYASVSTAHFHVSKLHELGFVDKINRKPRSIDSTNRSMVFRIPVIGNIAAGQPIEALEKTDSFIEVSGKELKTAFRHYALRVKGDSMVDEGIFDGDIVVIRQQTDADNGQTVVAIVGNNEATLKKIYKEKTKIRLQPANQQMLPFFEDKVEVRGIVVKIIRNLDSESKKESFIERKDLLLSKIRSKNPNSQNKYQRVALSPIRYAGGKSLAVGYVIELLPENIKRIISPFFGGGSIEIAINKYLGLEVLGYDIFDILCNYWKYQIEKPAILYSRLKELKPDKETFEKIRLILNDVWKKRIELDPETLAVFFVYNFNLSYGPGFMGWSSDIYLDTHKYNRMIERIRDFSTSNLSVECADFEDVIKTYPNDFLYCDPPYYLGDGSKMFKGIYPMRNIPVHHNGFKHDKLRDLLRSHKGGFILSYNDCSTIREYYKDFQIFVPSWQYSMGQGETRIGLNRIKNGDNHIKQSHELLIYSPPYNC